MNRSLSVLSARAALLASCAGLATSATAAVPLEKIIENTDPIPGVTVAPGTTGFWKLGFIGAYAGGSGVSIDNTGKVIFRADLDGTGIITTGTPTTLPNNVGVWHGSPGAVNLVIRNGDLNPANDPAGRVIGHGDFGSFANGLTNYAQYSLSPNGTNMAFAARMADLSDPSAQTYAALWAGPSGSMSKVMASGGFNPIDDLAPGTVNTRFSTQMTDAWTGTLNNAGQVMINGSLVSNGPGSDTIDFGPNANTAAVYVGSSYGTLDLVYRVGTTVIAGPGVTPNAVLGSTISSSLNGGGKIAGATYLREGVGDSPVTGTNDGVVITNHGGVLRAVAAEGGNVPGLPGVQYAQFAGGWFGPESPFATGPQSFNNNGRILYFAALAGGVTDGVDNYAFFVHNANTSTTSTAMRLGSSASSLVFGTTHASLPTAYESRLNNNNKVVFVNDIAGSGVDDSNNNVLWMRNLNTSSNTLVAREGRALDGLDQRTDLYGVSLGSMFQTILNNKDTIVFSSYLTGAGVTFDNDLAVFAWDEVGGLTMILREGDNLGTNGSGVSSLADFVVSFMSYSTDGTSEGGSLSLSDGNWLALNVVDSLADFDARNSMILRVQIPAPGAAGLLALGGLIAARRRRA